jgi:hypothetical protein
MLTRGPSIARSGHIRRTFPGRAPPPPRSHLAAQEPDHACDEGDGNNERRGEGGEVVPHRLMTSFQPRIWFDAASGRISPRQALAFCERLRRRHVNGCTA